jgi:hypothetical protein
MPIECMVQPGQPMMRTIFTILSAILAVSALPSQRAGADEVRHITFPSALVGRWAPSAELCAAKDKSNVTIVNMILRPEAGDKVSIGTSFTDLKPYLRCP